MSGFEVFNDAGFKIAGSDFPNLVFYGKHELVTTNWNINGPGFGGEDFIGSAPIPADGAVIRFYRPLSGHHLVEQDGRIFSEAAGARFECYSFGPVVADPSIRGLELYSSSGVLTFNTSRPFLKLAGVFIDPTQVSVPDIPAPYPYTVSTPFSEGGRKLAFQFSNAHYFYRLVRPSGRPYNVSYNTVRVAQIGSDGVFHCRYINKYQWTHGFAHSRVREIPNKEAPQRVLVADVTGL